MTVAAPTDPPCAVKTLATMGVTATAPPRTPCESCSPLISPQTAVPCATQLESVLIELMSSAPCIPRSS
eukprot:scaffold56689_cov60-Phaeocystis_antarctica.AAC.2